MAHSLFAKEEPYLYHLYFLKKRENLHSIENIYQAETNPNIAISISKALHITDRHGTITARNNYELTRNIPKCMGVKRLCNGANIQIPFNADEINLIYQFGEQSKMETCAKLTERDHSFHKGNVRQGKGIAEKADSCRGKTAQNGKAGMEL